MPIPQQQPSPPSPRPASGIPPAPAARSGAGGPSVPPPAAASGPEEFDPVAAILAFVFPGAGHYYLGEPKRAVLIAAGILGLFFGGILIGGIDVIDRQEDTIWFAGEALVGPLAFGIDYLHQHRFKVTDPATGQVRSAYPGEVRGPDGKAAPAQPGQSPPNSKSIGRMNELGTLFSTIAGMLNLIVIIDAAIHTRRARRF